MSSQQQDAFDQSAAITGTAVDADVAELGHLGYKQELNRVLGFFASFALQFSLISVGGGIFLLFNYGLITAGPAFFWAWVIGGALQMTVGLSMAELASAYPLAGSAYNWLRRLSNDSLAWNVGYILMVAHIAALAGLDYGIAPYFLNFVGIANPSTLQVTIVTFVCLAIQTVLNVVSVKLSSLINNIGVAAELVGMSSVIVLLTILGLHQGPALLVNTAGTATQNGYILPFFLVLLIPAWTISSFDSTCNIAEETKNAAHTAPRGAMTANLSAYVYGIVIIAIVLLSITNLTATTNAPLPILYIMQTHLGFVVATVFEAIVITGLFVCAMMLELTAARIIWGQARDGALPASGWLHKLNRGQVPANATIVSGIVAAIFCIWSGALSVLAALAALAWAFAYGVTVAVSLFAKFKGRLPEDRGWNLGRWGIANDIVALIWSIALCALLPLSGIGPVFGGFVAVVIVGLLMYYFWVKPRWSPPALPEMRSNEDSGIVQAHE